MPWFLWVAVGYVFGVVPMVWLVGYRLALIEERRGL